MATREINLIPSKRALSERQLRTQRLIFRTTTGVLVGVVLALSSIWGYSLVVASELNTLDRTIAENTAFIASRRDEERLYSDLKRKAVQLSQALGNRYPFSETFAFLKNISLEGSQLSSISISDIGRIGVGIDTPNSAVLEQFVQKVLAEAEKRFTQVELVGVEYDTETGVYTINLEINSKTAL